MPKSRDDRGSAELLDTFYQETLLQPLDYFRHDSTAHEDRALRLLVYEFGVEVLGVYWLLMEVLAGEKGHHYDVSEESGWFFLSQSMSACGRKVPFEPAEVRTWCKVFLESGLLDSELYSERQAIGSARLDMEAHNFAEATAKRKLAAARTNKKRSA